MPVKKILGAHVLFVFLFFQYFDFFHKFSYMKIYIGPTVAVTVSSSPKHVSATGAIYNCT